MNLSGNTVLVTGGASGIGLAFAKRFLERGNDVIICGRRQDWLAQVELEFPQIHTRVCDVSDRSARENFVQWAISEFPAVNVLVNNAGIQRRVDLTKSEDWEMTRSEI